MLRPSPLLCILALTLALAGAALGVSATQGDVAGTLLDRRTNRPIANATVRVFGGPQEGSARTDGDGKYRLANLLPGDYDLLLQKPGYNTQHRAPVLVTANATTTLDALLEWSDNTVGAVEVRVQDRARKPLPGATVDLLAAGILLSRSVTDDAGVQVFPGVEPGIYDVQVRRSGYVANAGRVQVRAANTSVLTLKLQRSLNEVGRLSGVIRNVGGETLSGARVKIIDGLSAAQVTTRGDGRYDFAGLIPGDDYALEVTLAGYQTQVRANLRVLSQSQTIADFRLVPQQAQKGSITGRVHDAEGDPLPFATVRISSGPGMGTEVVAGEDGRYTLTGLAPGSYALVAEQDGFSPAGRSGLAVEAGKTKDVDFELTPILQPLGSIAGKVREAGTGLLLSGVVVEILAGPSTGLATQTDGSGNYVLLGVKPDESYTLRFRRDGYQSLSQPLVNVSPGVRTEVNANLTPQGVTSGALEGRVRRYGAGVLPGVTVALFEGPTSPLEGETDRQGAFAFRNLRPGSGYGLRLTRKGYVTLTRKNINLGDGQTLDLGEFVMRRASEVGTLRGTVVDLLNRPIANARVSVLVGPSTPADIITGANGQFQFEALIPGTYTLQASANNFVSRTKPFLNVGAGQVTNTSIQLLPAL